MTAEGPINTPPRGQTHPRQETEEERLIAEAEKSVMDIVTVNTKVAEAYAENHEYSSWQCADVAELVKEYRENPSYREQYMQVVRPYEDTFGKFPHELPPSLYERLLGHDVAVLAWERGLIEEQEMGEATDLVSRVEFPLAGMTGLEIAPPMYQRRQEIYTRFKEKYGMDTIDRLRLLTRASSALAWITVDFGEVDGGFSKEDVVSLTDESASIDENAFHNDRFNYLGARSNLLRGEEEGRTYSDKLRLTFFKDRLKRFVELDQTALDELRVTKRERSMELGVDITHFADWDGNFLELEKEEDPYYTKVLAARFLRFVSEKNKPQLKV